MPRTQTENKAKRASILEGSILPVTFKLGLPILLSNILNSLYAVVDIFFLSLIDRSSTAIISSVALVVPVSQVFIAITMGLNVGITAQVAHHTGDTNQEKLHDTFSSGLALAVIISVISIIIGYSFLNQIVYFLAGKELSNEVIQYGISYLFYLIPGLIILLIGHVFFGILRGEGNTMPILIAVSVSTLINIILDPLFIFYFKMGVPGAAIATTISFAFAAFFILFILQKQKRIFTLFRISNIKIGAIGEIVKIGFSQALVMLSFSAGMMILNNIVSSIGQMEMNSWGLCGKTNQIVVLPVQAIMGANIIMIGQNYGRKNTDRVKKIYQYNTLAGVLITLLISLIYVAAAPLVFSLFSSNKDVIRESILHVQIVAFSFAGLAVEMISINTFQGLKKPVPAFFLIVFRLLIIAVSLTCLFHYVFHLGMIGVYAALSTAHMVSAVISFFWVRSAIKT